MLQFLIQVRRSIIRIEIVFIFYDLGFAVYFSNDVTSSIAINHDSGASLHGGITVGMSSEDILSIIDAKPAIEDTDSFIYLVDVDGNFTEAIDKEQFSRAQFSLSFNFKDNLVETIIISNDF